MNEVNTKFRQRRNAILGEKMLDIKIIRENPQEVVRRLGRRNQEYDLSEILQWDMERRKVVAELDALRERRNKISEEVGKLKREKLQVSPQLQEELDSNKSGINERELFVNSIEQRIEDALLRIPNIPDDNIPDGKNSQNNREVKRFGNIPEFSFKPKHHTEIGEKLGVLDFETAAKLSGARFALLKGDGCVLERSLINFMLDVHRSRGYSEVMPPYLVSAQSMRGTGQLPKFEEELFKCSEDNLYLIPTAEVPVTNMHRSDILEEKDLPKKYVAYTPCFRREAGSYGKDTKGLIRNHQFNKVEIVKFSKPADSMAELETLLNDAEEVLRLLEIPYRVVELCAGDLGFSSAKTYDIEVWMPSENNWREISSCSNFMDFQARRMDIKLRYSDKKKDFVHTLNGSGVAVGRAFAAILENFQTQDGSVVIPKVLIPYTKFEKIGVK